MQLPIKRRLIAEVLVILGLAGCAAPRPNSTGTVDPATATATAPGAATGAAPAPATAADAATASAPSASAGTPVISGGSTSEAPSAAATPPGAAAPSHRPAPSPKAAPVARAAPSAGATPAAPKSTLNLAELEQRLRDTHAIGVFTKLSLKNQVDDLLDAFRDLYRDPKQRPSAELRQRYDLLLLKVLTLLQDGDPVLAAAISSSREAIWSILSDPDKFAQI